MSSSETPPVKQESSALSTEQGTDVPPSGDGEGCGKPRRMWLKALLAVFALLVFAGGGAAWFVFDYLHSAPEKPGRDVEIVITPGMSFKTLSAELEKKGVIRHLEMFRMLASYRKLDKRVRMGRFLVSTGWTPEKVLIHLMKGRPHLERFTIPEGLTLRETGRRLEQAGFVRADDFAAVVRDAEFLKQHDIPFETAEGFLFPETYTMMRPLELNAASAREVAGLMIDTFWRHCTPILPEGIRFDGKELRKLVTLASIVEKETALSHERARVAGVYANRLEKRMLLQADPTVIYGLGEAFAGRLRRSHLDDAGNPYNTYRHTGLPPGPICSFGLASLKAAVSPEEHGFLYFVATGTDGSHVFSATLEEHNRAVQAYRAALRAAGRR